MNLVADDVDVDVDVDLERNEATNSEMNSRKASSAEAARLLRIVDYYYQEEVDCL
jgi:hypothetical protein